MLRLRDYPREFLVGDSLWKLRFVRVVPERARKGREVIGLACPETQTIYVQLRLTHFDRFVVVIHELTHCMEDEFDFEIDHDTLNKLDKSWAKFMYDNFFGGSGHKTRLGKKAKEEDA